MNHKPVFLLGDTHSPQPCIRICREIPENSILIHVGDFGAFDEPIFWESADRLGKLTQKKNIEFLVIRGNHCQKSLYTNRKIYGVTMLEDYSERVINGERFLFIGGGYSVDRVSRLRHGWCYDPNEPMIYKPTTPCDILISHTGPRRYLDHLLTFPIERYFAIDANLKDDLQREQDMVDDILCDCKPKVHVWGHFHVSHKCRDNGTVFQCLNVEEVKTLEEIRS